MVTIRNGITNKHASSQRLIAFFKNNQQFNGHLYIGYPILYSANDSTSLDAVWISKELGVLIFDLIESANIDDRKNTQDSLFGLLESQLTGYNELKIGRRLAVQMEVITYSPACAPIDVDYLVAFDDPNLKAIIDGINEWDNPNLFENVLSIIQSVINLKTKTKRVTKYIKDSKGDKISKLENTIATLDNDQEEAIIDFFDGLQRIRGLAGSGKTIVLALKAAYLHAQNPDWMIAVTFNTRALKDQFKSLITRFCIEKKRELPDWNKIRIINAWGRPKDIDIERGLYYDFCYENSILYYDYKSAEEKTLAEGGTSDEAFENVCNSAISAAKKPFEKYDAILVDEAQDLSQGFLNLCFRFLKKPKRLIYAYDELQKLNEGSPLPNPKVIFSRDAQDTILKKCYRNSRPLLVTAHALGFGIYREKGLVQFFDQPQLWKDVGYQIASGNLSHGQDVTLVRSNESSPEYLETHSDLNDLIIFKRFKNAIEQAAWIANEIGQNITNDELLHEDIIVINPIALTTEKNVSGIRVLLSDKGINTHIAGKFNPDKFFQSNSIAFSGINRAKGNEVPMVYIINADDCYSHPYLEKQDLIRRRNILFTAITRSKAWVRVCGIGERMDKLINEYEQVRDSGFELRFKYPSEDDIRKMNLIHRDVSESEVQKIKDDETAVHNILTIVEKIKDGKAYIEDYSKETQEILNLILTK